MCCVEAHGVLPTGIEREHGREPDSIVLDRVAAEHRGQITGIRLVRRYHRNSQQLTPHIFAQAGVSERTQLGG